jgi:hypothetical protein
MKTKHLLLAATILFVVPRAGYGAAIEEIGPVKVTRRPVFEPPEWPSGTARILEHDSRVYSIWVNGNENFYFKAAPDEINELIQLYSAIRVRDHVVNIKQSKKDVRTFKGDKIEYNVKLHVLGGIALGRARRGGAPETHDPTLTIFVDPDVDRAWWKTTKIPGNLIVSSEVPNWPVKSKAAKPKRRRWYAQVIFADETPAADFENDVLSRVTLWEKDGEGGFNLGKVSHKGTFSAAFSKNEIAQLKAGKMWLTLTVGNHRTFAKKGDTNLDLKHLSPDRKRLKAVEVARPAPKAGRTRGITQRQSPPR